MTSEICTCVEMNAPELFADEEFAAWLKRRAGEGLATWHCGGDIDEMSDVFVTYDHGEGSDASYLRPMGMPEHAWELICRECERLGVDYAVVRLTNCQE